MDCIQENVKKIPVADSCDVLVAGGGIAGIAAAVAAARNGADVLLIEREYALGGMATLGLVTIFLPLCDGEGHQLIAGLGEELLKLSIVNGAEILPPPHWLKDSPVEERKKARYIARFNPQIFALEAERLLLSLGVKILYGTLVSDVSVKQNRIEHVILENKSGRSAVKVRSVVDTSGDADVAARSGAETALFGKGNKIASWYYFAQDGKVDLKMFGLADVPEQKSGRVINDHTDYQAQAEDLNGDLRFSGVDGEELSNAVVAAHRYMFEDILARKKENATLVPVTMSTIPLVRMSRRIAGCMVQDEKSDHQYIDDSIGMTGDWRRVGPVFELSYRTLYGPDIKNLICAGRCISVTDEMWDITRVIPPCAVTGQAAGTAAALTDTFADLDVHFLQAKLKDQNVLLHFCDL